MTTARELLQVLEDYKREPESAGLKLRLDLASIILERLKERRWNQRQLANLSNMKESFVSRVLHADANCTFETAGKLLFALGVDASITDARAVDSTAATFEITFDAEASTTTKFGRPNVQEIQDKTYAIAKEELTAAFGTY